MFFPSEERLARENEELEKKVFKLKLQLAQYKKLAQCFQKEYLDLYFEYSTLRAEHTRLFDEARFGKLDHQ